MPNLRNGSKGDSNPGSLDCDSGIIPMGYRAPFNIKYRSKRAWINQSDKYYVALFCHHGYTLCHPNVLHINKTVQNV